MTNIKKQIKELANEFKNAMFPLMRRTLALEFIYSKIINETEETELLQYTNIINIIISEQESAVKLFDKSQDAIEEFLCKIKDLKLTQKEAFALHRFNLLLHSSRDIAWQQDEAFKKHSIFQESNKHLDGKELKWKFIYKKSVLN